MSVADYNTDPNSNTSISGINIAEGCPPSGINNALRQMMADIKTADDADVKLSGDQSVGGKKTFSSTVKVSGTGAIGFRVDNTTAPRSVDIRAQDNGNAGVWDTENNRWMIHANNGAVTEIPDGLTTAAPAASDNSTRVPTTAWVGSNAVMLSGDQTIAGTKTFSSGVYSDGDYLVRRNFAFGTWPSSIFFLSVGSKDINGLTGSWISFRYSSTLSSVRLYCRKSDDDSTSATSLPYVEFAYRKNEAVYAWEPNADNSYYLGYSSSRWKQLYAGTTTISTSDERLKDNISAVPDAVLDAWGDVNWSQFQFRDSIAEKGTGKARLHNGLVAQRIDAAFKAHGQDASRYGLFCYDEWEATPEEKDEQGNVTEEGRPAGNIYSLRYEEALAMEAAYQRRRADRAEARISALERRLDEMEAVLATLGA